MGQTHEFRVFVGAGKEYCYSLDPDDTEARLGEGGFGEVFRCVRVADREIFAVKRILKTASNRPNVMRELQTLISSCNHPNIVKLYHFDFLSLNYYHLIMEYCPGGNLATILERSVDEEGIPQPLPISQIRGFLRDIVSGVAYLHSLSSTIVHRDLKPANLVLSSTGGLKLCDFGFARIVDSSTMSPVGSYAYCAPEIRRVLADAVLSPNRPAPNDLHYLPSVDIYSVGAILYEMLHNRRYDLSVSRQNVREPTTPLELCFRMVSENPLARPTCEEILEELDRCEEETVQEQGGVSSLSVSGDTVPILKVMFVEMFPFD